MQIMEMSRAHNNITKVGNCWLNSYVQATKGSPCTILGPTKTQFTQMNGPGFRVLPYGQCPAARELNWKLQLLNYMYIAQAVRALYFILKTILTQI